MSMHTRGPLDVLVNELALPQAQASLVLQVGCWSSRQQRVSHCGHVYVKAGRNSRPFSFLGERVRMCGNENDILVVLYIIPLGA